MGKIIKDIRLTFKEDESDIKKFLESKSSPTCFLKDLARIEMEKEKRMLENYGTKDVLEQIKALLEQKPTEPPVINITAQLGNAPAELQQQQQTEKKTDYLTTDDFDDEEFNIDVSDI